MEDISAWNYKSDEALMVEEPPGPRGEPEGIPCSCYTGKLTTQRDEDGNLVWIDFVNLD